MDVQFDRSFRYQQILQPQTSSLADCRQLSRSIKIFRILLKLLHKKSFGEKKINDIKYRFRVKCVLNLQKKKKK